LKTKTVAYYRLKEIDNDGQGTYSNTLVVKLKAQEGVVIQTTPNPFAENLSVRFTATENGTALISIVNINGQQVLAKQADITKGYVTIQMNGLAKLAPGMYVAQVTVNGVVAGSQKIIKN